VDRAYTSKEIADRSAAERNDGATVVPLYASPVAADTKDREKLKAILARYVNRWDTTSDELSNRLLDELWAALSSTLNEREKE
jgi:hypothetical protein